MIRCVIAALIVFAALPARADPDHAGLAQRALVDHILPGFERLAEAAQVLRAEADAACSGNGPIERQPVNAAYDATFEAWARIGHVRFGPAEENSAGFAVEFWPDTRGATPRTIGSLIASEDPAVDDPAAFHGLSVAARGLMAADYLMFDPDAPAIEAGSYRCRLLEAIAGDLVTTAGEILEGWRGPWGEILTSAGSAENPVYLAPEETTAALYSALTEGLQADVDLRLGRPLGTFEQPQPRRAEAWRSKRSLPNVRASLEGLREMTMTVFGPAVPPVDSDAVDAAFARALAAVDRVGGPIDVEVAMPQGRFRVEALQSAVRGVQSDVAEHLGPAIGVTSGFNSMDGD